MALLDNANERGDFNSTGRGARASQGVDYFSNVVPGLQSIQSDLPADVGWRAGPEEQFIRSGGTLDTGPRRDLKTDPLSPWEVSAANMAAEVAGSVFGPVGSLIGAGIQGKLGYNGYDTPGSFGREVGLAGSVGRNIGLGQPLTDAIYNAARGYAENDPGYGLSAMDKNQIDRGALNPASIQAQMRAAGVASEADGTSGTPFGGVTIGAPIAPSAIQSTELAPLGGGGGGGGYRGGSEQGMGNAGDASGGFGTSHSSFAANGGLATGTGFESPVGLSIPGYADGGPMMPNGPLLAMGFAGGGQVAGMGNPGGDVSPDMINMRVNQLVRDPRFVQSITQTLQPLMQSGELTPQEVQVMGQIAEASLQNPKLYPQLRQFVAQQGMTPLPPSFDPTVITKILAISRALAQAGGGMSQPGQATPPGQIPPTDQAQMQNPTGTDNGGLLQGPGTGRSDSIGTVNESTGQPVKVATGEYVIPEHVVRAKGRDFFDALLRRYASIPKAGE